MVPLKKTRLTLVVDPRFSGGTSSAVAREILSLAAVTDLTVVALSSRLFKGKDVHPAILSACHETGTPISWDPAVVSADVVALHNPSFLKFNTTLGTKLRCDRLFIVCHENLLRPDGPESFDVGHCLSVIAEATLARVKMLAPISGWNRHCAQTWMATHPSRFALAPIDWTNICDFDLIPPTQTPKDRRGRHSRAGVEKFPTRSALETMFPESAEAVHILGADSLLASDPPSHWHLQPFGSEAVDRFLEKIDFFVYFTHPLLQESFGRVIAEALAAGKVVITCEGTAATFGDGVIAATPQDVDAIVARLVADPAAYATQVERGQKALRAFSSEAFVARFHALIRATDQHYVKRTTQERILDLL